MFGKETPSGNRKLDYVDPRDFLRYLDDYKCKLLGLITPKSSHKSDRIRRGYQRLIEDTFTYDELVSNAWLEDLQITFVDLFWECLRQDPFLVSDNVRSAVWRSGLVISPQDAELLIDRYGLSDGEERKYIEIARKYHMNVSTVRKNIRRAQNRLLTHSNYEKIKPLCHKTINKK